MKKKTTKNEMTCFSWLVYSDSVDLFIVTALFWGFFATKLNETETDRQSVRGVVDFDSSFLSESVS